MSEIRDSQFLPPDDFYYSDEEVFERANGIDDWDEETWFDQGECLLGDRCLMLGLHTEDECHTSEMLEEYYKEGL